jgi:hypothetical protein
MKNQESRNFLDKMKQGNNDFIGTWHIIKMSEWDNDYVNEEVKAYIKIEKTGMGEFHFGFVQCSMSGDFKEKESIYDFTFEGNAECDPTNGDGWIKIKQDGTAEGEIRSHMGDCSKFWAEKAQ